MCFLPQFFFKVNTRFFVLLTLDRKALSTAVAQMNIRLISLPPLGLSQSLLYRGYMILV